MSGHGPEDFGRDGYAVWRGVFDRARIDALCAEAERLRGFAAGLRETTVCGPVRWLIRAGADGQPVLRGLQYPYRLSPAFDAIRADPAIQRLLAPLIADDVVSIVGTMFWKPAGRAETAVAYHQDAAFRQPRERYRNLATSYVQVGLALDPQGPGNGGMRVVAGSHRLGDLAIRRAASVMADAPTEADLAEWGVDPGGVRDLVLRPGDVVAWHPYLLHGSPPNASRADDRRFYVIGYMRAGDADDGEPAFTAGRPCPLPA